MPERAARERWKAARTGRCAVCGKRGRILRHHCVYEAHVRREGGDRWDLRNALDVGAYCLCHGAHHNASQRINQQLLPDSALEFAAELLGPARAALYFNRYYQGADSRVEALEREEVS